MERSLLDLFQPARHCIKTAAQWVAASTQSSDFNPGLNRLFFPLLRNHSPITSVVAGSPEGQGYMLLQQPDGTWLARLTDIEKRGEVQNFIHYAQDETEISSFTRNLDYDHRKRPWFKAAMETSRAEVLCWTPPYELFTTKDPGVTLSTRVNRKDGRSIVLGLDIMLRDISRFTSTHRIGKEGFMLMMTAEQRIVGYPPAEMCGRKERTGVSLETVDALESNIVDQALITWEAQKRQLDKLYRFRAEGKTWYAKISPFDLGDKRFWIAMFAPRAEFAPPWSVVAAYMLVAMLMVLGLVLLATRKVAQKIAEPITSIASSSEAIARLEFHPPEFKSCSIHEIERLVDSHMRMSNLIQESIATVESQKRELSHKVEELHATRDRLRENEVELQQNLNYVQVFFDSPLMGIALVRRRTLTDCNRTFCALTGYAPSEVKGMPTRDLYAFEEDYVRIARESAPMFKAGKIYTTEVQLLSRSGDVVWARISGCLFDRSDPDRGSMWIAIPLQAQADK
jgi:PAS domain S-box-containing protein